MSVPVYPERTRAAIGLPQLKVEELEHLPVLAEGALLSRELVAAAVVHLPLAAGLAGRTA